MMTRPKVRTHQLGGDGGHADCGGAASESAGCDSAPRRITQHAATFDASTIASIWKAR